MALNRFQKGGIRNHIHTPDQVVDPATGEASSGGSVSGISDVPGLQDELDGKSSTGHNHDASYAKWTQDINESGTSFANWTANGGTWASDGTTINQTDTGAAVRYAEYATAFASGWPFILEFEAQVITASGRAGIGLFDASQNSAAMAFYIQQGTGVVLEQTGSAVVRTITTTINQSTWYKIRAVVGTLWMSLYKDGSFIGTVLLGNRVWDPDMEYVALYSYAASVKFRNVKAWTLSGGAPA